MILTRTTQYGMRNPRFPLRFTIDVSARHASRITHQLSHV